MIWPKFLKIADSRRISVQLILLILCQSGMSLARTDGDVVTHSCSMPKALSCIFLP